MAAAPDLVLTGARLFDTGGDALAIRDGAIVAIGGRHDMLATAGPATEVRELPPGSLLCPGFHDAHLHLHSMAEAARERSARGLGAEAVLDLVRSAAGDAAWLVVAEVSDTALLDPALAAHLDDVAPHTPVLLRAHDHHTVRVNDAGRMRAGLERAADGLLREGAAFAAIEAARDRPAPERRDALVRTLTALRDSGLTAVHEMSGSSDLQLLVDVAAAGRLPIDVFATLTPGTAAPTTTGGLHVIGVKAFLDGALGSRTAHLLDSYAPDGHEAEPVMTAAEVRDVVREADERGLPVLLHAIGDAAVRTALDALQDAQPRPTGAPRHRIEHAQTVHPDDVARFRALGVVASVQPSHLIGDAAAVERSLATRASRAFPLRSLRDAGAVLAFGSDAPIERADPLAAVRAAVDRVDARGRPFGAAEALTVGDCLRALSPGPAFAAGRQHEIGRVAVGQRACLSVLSHDIEQMPEALEDARTFLTVVDGAVYGEMP